MTRICTKCGIEKNLSEFSYHPLGKFNTRSKCKLCCTKESIIYNNLHKKERKRYYLDNKEKLLKQHKEYHIKNKEHVKEQTKDYRERKHTSIKKQQKRWRKLHKNFIRNRERELRKSNIQFRLRCIFRNRIRQALKNNKKSNSTINLLGCSIRKAKKYLESKFQPGMSWDNYGYYGWHIDHIRPCASFDLSKPEEQKACFHYSNLQPLWWYDNLRKGPR
jgi:hypothetical protein